MNRFLIVLVVSHLFSFLGWFFYISHLHIPKLREDGYWTMYPIYSTITGFALFIFLYWIVPGFVEFVTYKSKSNKKLKIRKGI